VFLPRHGRGHRYTPTEVNYRANVFGLKLLHCKWVVGVSAVGSLQEEVGDALFLPTAQLGTAVSVEHQATSSAVDVCVCVCCVWRPSVVLIGSALGCWF
jgi:hypothetical protein